MKTETLILIQAEGPLYFLGLLASCQEDIIVFLRNHLNSSGSLLQRKGIQLFTSTNETDSTNHTTRFPNKISAIQYSETIKQKTMRRQFKLLALIVVVTIGIQACKDTDPVPEINPLTADAGENQEVAIGETVTLDGSESKDDEGENFSYAWSVKSKPAGSLSTLGNATTVAPEFTPDKAGAYVIELKITKNQWSSIDEVTVTVSGSSPPAIVELSENITEDLILEDIFTDNYTKIDYLVTTPISVSAKLTIRPGVRVAFAENSGMLIETTGAFVAEGGATQEDMIYITGEQEAVGYWVGIVFQSGNEENKMKNTVFSGAGANPGQEDFSAGMYFDAGSKIAIEHSTFSQNNTLDIFMAPGAVLSNFTNNKITASTSENFSIAIPVDQVAHISGNNQFDGSGIAVLDDYLNTGTEVEWPSYAYTLLSGMTVANNTTLNLGPMTRIQVAEDERIAVVGGSAIKATSIEANNTVFTGYGDDVHWQGILIEDSGDNPTVLNHVTVYGAGSTPLSGNQAASIHIGSHGVASIDNCSIMNGLGDGIEATSEKATIISFNENRISGHQGYPMSISAPNVQALDGLTFFTANAINKVRIDGNYPIAKDQETVWKGFLQQQMSYEVSGMSNDLVVWSGLKLEEGVIIEMQANSRIVVEDANGRQGYLKADGTANKNVIIKNVDELAGSWYGITFSSTNAKNQLSYTQLLHGGKKIDNNFSASITVDNSPEGSLSIQNSTIGYSGQHGIAVANTMRNKLNDSNLTFIDIPENQIYAW